MWIIGGQQGNGGRHQLLQHGPHQLQSLLCLLSFIRSLYLVFLSFPRTLSTFSYQFSAFLQRNWSSLASCKLRIPFLHVSEPTNHNHVNSVLHLGSSGVLLTEIPLVFGHCFVLLLLLCLAPKPEV